MMLSKKEKAEHKAKSMDESDEELEPYLIYVNNLLFLCSPIVKFILTIQWSTTAMDYILIKHNYRTNSTRWQWLKKEWLLVIV